MKINLLAGCASPAAIFAASGSNVSFATDDWLNTALVHCVVEGDRAVHISMISHGARGHAEFLETFRQWLDLDCAVQKAVVSVKVKMCEVLAFHGAKIFENFGTPGDSELIRNHTISRGVEESTKQYIEFCYFRI